MDLVKALLLEKFGRMKNAGVEHCYLSSAPEPNPSNSVYEGLGVSTKEVFEFWVKAY